MVGWLVGSSLTSSQSWSHGDVPLSWSMACLVSAPEVGYGHREPVDRADLPSPYPRPLCPAWPFSLGLFVLQSR